jgi:uncharacterized damage-inducible protein DinB
MRPTLDNASNAPAELIEASRTLLMADYLPKLRRFAALITEEDVWWRPNAASNSVGNLLLHMSGSLRQWIVGGVGGEPNERDRDSEFSAKGGRSLAELMEMVEATAASVDRTLAQLRETSLTDRITVQRFSVTRLHAVYHAIEHFGYHLGQIAYVAKLRKGEDLSIFP